MRTPSSFHSTAAGPTRPSATSTDVAVRASIGETGRPTCSPTRSSPVVPSASATSATAASSPASMAARRTAPGSDPGRARHRVEHQAGERTLPQLPAHQPDQELLL